jgi:hypothetical protein
MSVQPGSLRSAPSSVPEQNRRHPIEFAMDWPDRVHTNERRGWPVKPMNDGEKSISLLIQTGRNVNASESNREQSGIIRRQFCGIKRQRQFFEVP